RREGERRQGTDGSTDSAGRGVGHRRAGQAVLVAGGRCGVVPELAKLDQPARAAGRAAGAHQRSGVRAAGGEHFVASDENGEGGGRPLVRGRLGGGFGRRRLVFAIDQGRWQFTQAVERVAAGCGGLIVSSCRRLRRFGIVQNVVKLFLAA